MNDSTHGIIFNIQRFAIHDGPGIRTTVFFKGCPLRCWWCHNPESHKILPEKIDGCNLRRGFDQSFTMNKDEIGKDISVDELMNEIVKDRVFYEESNGGVTFSGGEPLMQPEFLKEMLEECQANGIHTVVDTSGFASTDIITDIAQSTDLFLYDIKLMNDDKHQEYTGVSNQIILKNLIEVDKLGKKIIIRVPIVPELNDTNENLFAIRGFISYLNNVVEVNLLPYHRAGEGKYTKYGRENKMGDTVSPERKNLENIREFFIESKQKVKIGG
ncbi:MAG TPA: glycyl-radical enzyme activating protein [Ignavibacteriaceae bacterium]|nr:glycyl-radical enzyme activating protein [Ignavibacteriaceae bacterium]